MEMFSLDHPIEPSHYQFVEDMIVPRLSDGGLCIICDANPDFADWYASRLSERTASAHVG